MPAETWHYMQNQNPDPYRFFVNYVRNMEIVYCFIKEYGYEQMSQKYEQKQKKL